MKASQQTSTATVTAVSSSSSVKTTIVGSTDASLVDSGTFESATPLPAKTPPARVKMSQTNVTLTTTQNGTSVTQNGTSAGHAWQSETEYTPVIGSREPYTRKSPSNDPAMGWSLEKYHLHTDMHDMPSKDRVEIAEHHEHEKKIMQELNDRFSKLYEKLGHHGEEKHSGTVVPNLWDTVEYRYEKELKQTRKDYEAHLKRTRELEVSHASLKEEHAKCQTRYEDLCRARDGDQEKMHGMSDQLARHEATIRHQERLLKNMEDELLRLKQEIHALHSQLKQARKERDDMTIERENYRDQAQWYSEELQFSSGVHAQEMKVMKSMVTHETTTASREFFKNELVQAVHDIRTAYELTLSQNKADMHARYQQKEQHLIAAATQQQTMIAYHKDEVIKLRNQLSALHGQFGDLHGQITVAQKQNAALANQQDEDRRTYQAQLRDKDAQIAHITAENRRLLDQSEKVDTLKQSLGAEIRAYQTMIEGVESRVTGPDNWSSGHVSIVECDAGGKFITLENNHHGTDEKLGHWIIRQKAADGTKKLEYAFPETFVLCPGKRVTVCSWKDGGKASPPDKLVADEVKCWATGNNTTTVLLNKEGQEMAHHIHRHAV